MAAVALTGTTPREELQKHADLVVESLRELDPGRLATLLPA